MLRTAHATVPQALIERYFPAAYEPTIRDLAEERQVRFLTEIEQWVIGRREQDIKRALDRALWPVGLKVVRIPGRWPGGRLRRMGAA